MSIALGYVLGRHYAIISRDKLKDFDFNDSQDVYDDMKRYINDKQNPPTVRIISPSKKKAVELKDFEDTNL